MTTKASFGREKPYDGEKRVFLRNATLHTIKKGYPGNPYKDGMFTGRYAAGAGKSILRILKWKLSKNPKAEEKRNDPFALKVVNHNHLPETAGDYLMWLGHASFLIHLGGKFIITDPCLTAPPLIPRLAPLPLSVEGINMDYMLISHGHYDHLDSDSLQMLHGDHLQALVPLRMAPIVNDKNQAVGVQEAGWFQQYRIDHGLEIYLLPAHHWHKRTMMDTNRVLWGSFLIRYKGKSIYFAGDTALSSHFSEIAELFGRIDYALLPIGAYDPSYIMKTSHMNPEEAVTAFHDLNARVLIPMHYGTFDLTDEPLGEPLRRLARLSNQKKVNGEVRVLDVGTVMPL